jgi:hypothetical protein
LAQFGHFTTPRGETSVLRLDGGGGELVLPDKKGVAEVVPDGRINIPFPKFVGERGFKKSSGHNIQNNLPDTSPFLIIDFFLET